MLRRLEKRILVDLPSREPRRAMFERHLPPTVVTGQHNGLELHAQLDYNTLADVSSPGVFDFAVDYGRVQFRHPSWFDFGVNHGSFRFRCRSPASSVWASNAQWSTQTNEWPAMRESNTHHCVSFTPDITIFAEDGGVFRVRHSTRRERGGHDARPEDL